MPGPSLHLRYLTCKKLLYGSWPTWATARIPGAGQPRDIGSHYRPAGGDRGDDVADPVDEVQKRALGLRARFTLNGHIIWGDPPRFCAQA